MKTSTVGAIVVGVLLAFAAVAATSGFLWSRSSTAALAATTPPPAVPPSTSSPLHPVTIPTGELVTALPPDAIGQVLCQAVDEDRWNLLLGAPTLREAQGDGCRLLAGPWEISLTLDRTAAALTGARPVDVAGHQGEVEFPRPGTNARLNARLVTVAPTEQVRPYLRVTVSSSGATPARPLDELSIDVARAVVSATMAPGPALPPVGPDRAIPLRQVRPMPEHGILDQPWPVISWQLCAELTRVLGGTGKPEFAGSCTVRGIQATYTDAVSPRRYPDTLAGRPALITDDLVAVELTDDSAQELTFTGSGRSLRTLAERVTPALLGQA